MRTIHEIHKHGICLTLSGSPYRGPVGTENEWCGWRCELLISSRDPLSMQEEPIYIEGNGDAVLEALEKAVVALKAEHNYLKERFDEATAAKTGTAKAKDEE